MCYTVTTHLSVPALHLSKDLLTVSAVRKPLFKLTEIFESFECVVTYQTVPLIHILKFAVTC